jgi:large subunit ribosomal protein L30
MNKLEVTKVKSTIRRPKNQKLMLLSLGLRKIGSKKVFSDTNSLRGVLKKVAHLVSVKEI